MNEYKWSELKQKLPKILISSFSRLFELRLFFLPFNRWFVTFFMHWSQYWSSKLTFLLRKFQSFSSLISIVFSALKRFQIIDWRAKNKSYEMLVSMWKLKWDIFWVIFQHFVWKLTFWWYRFSIFRIECEYREDALQMTFVRLLDSLQYASKTLLDSYNNKSLNSFLQESSFQVFTILAFLLCLDRCGQALKQ